MHPWKLRELVRRRDGDNCYYCGKPINFDIPAGEDDGPSLEHRRPKAAGGTDDIYNLALTHTACNQERAAIYEGIDWADVRDRQAKARNWCNERWARDA